MATPEEYYCRTWKFSESEAPSRAYPEGGEVTIGKQHRGKFMLSWIDQDRALHVLIDLTLSETGWLTSPISGARDLATGECWTISISPIQPAEEHDNISGRVDPINPTNPPHEGNLTGAWGADAPPPDPGDGQPSQLGR